MKGGVEEFDVIVIGSGSAGMSAVFSAREAGARVAMVERAELGGECPNWACVPSKALLRCAKAYRDAKRSALFGVHLSGIKHSFKRMMQYQSETIAHITGDQGERYASLLERAGVTLLRGEARFLDKTTIQVGQQQFVSKTFVLATGTAEFLPEIDGLLETPFWGFKDVMVLNRQPRSLIILGGGPVGCELATFFASIGTQVTLVEGAPTVLHREDPEIALRATRALERLGVSVHVGVQAQKVTYRRGGFLLSIDKEEEPLLGAHLLVVVGKRPALDRLQVEAIGLKTDARGYLLVDEKQTTSMNHVFAAGDVTGGMQFTHVAHPAGDVAGFNAGMKAMGKRTRRSFDLSVVPRVTFVTPEVASVGLTEEEAKTSYKKLLVGTFNVSALGRAVTDGRTEGLVKLVADEATGKLVGGHIIAERAGEMIHEVALAIKLGAKMSDLAEMIHAFPTYSEAISASASNVKVK